jgi:eukaryotic translation initiation factor 2C
VQVSAAEYAAIRRACADLEETYCPPITYVIASKAHRTRLFPADKENQDRSGNCLPGTVVDRDVCDSGMFDFYLNSHAGLQGHNKPAHYHVVVDENGFTADGLQLFTYWQCFLCCRCTRWVWHRAGAGAGGAWWEQPGCRRALSVQYAASPTAACVTGL